MEILLHTCCAPCAFGPVMDLRDSGFRPILYFFNPNIHPYREYSARLNTLKSFARGEGLGLIEDSDYDLLGFLREIIPDPRRPSRCRRCYALRLERTAKAAAERNFVLFSTTLLASPHQAHDAARAEGERAGLVYGVEFYYVDWRPNYEEYLQRAKEQGIYCQSYCGCIFSEEERFRKRPRGSLDRKG